jgi:hypothetical protein
VRRITQVLGLRVFSEEVTVDRYGNRVPGWADPVDVGVFAVSPKQSVEPDEVGRRAVLSGLTVYAPTTCPVTARDRVVYRGESWEVVGDPGVWADNPHGGFQEGVQFDLERSEG